MWESSLNSEQSAAVDALAARAADVDGFDPLNEEARFSRTPGAARHLLVAGPDRLVGYLVHSPGHRTAQLVVDPEHRRHRIGSRLVEILSTEAPPRLWAFHDAPPAQGFARHLGLVEGRALLVMGRPLPDDTHPAAAPDDGVRLRGYRPDDAGALLAVNAAAFAHHPEQGGLDADGLATRMNEDWFDPEGLIVAVEDGRMLGFHWTKQVGELGEVYVIGVDPAAQGRGLGRRLLRAGLDHLTSAGCRSVILYVDSADTVAVGMYSSAGFDVVHRDVLYVPATKEQQ